jgi:hypothetical protein
VKLKPEKVNDLRSLATGEYYFNDEIYPTLV